MATIVTFISTSQVDITAVFGIVCGVLQFLSGRIIGSLTDGTSLTTTENLERVASIQVDGGGTPDL